MDKIAKISSVQRAELFQQTASKFPFLSEAAIEKDFWVCWILKQVFMSPLKDIVIFKGGTSLSKIFKLIHRFSEDIDLILNWKDNPIGDPMEVRTYTSQGNFNVELDNWSCEFIKEHILPEIQKICDGVCTAEIIEDKPDNISSGTGRSKIPPEIPILWICGCS